MTLDSDSRGLLENAIDEAIKATPSLIREYRQPHIKQALHIQSENDFILGLMFATIAAQFTQNFTRAKGRKPSKEELSVVREVVYRRAAEIREAIFKMG